MYSEKSRNPFHKKIEKVYLLFYEQNFCLEFVYIFLGLLLFKINNLSILHEFFFFSFLTQLFKILTEPHFWLGLYV